MPFPKTGACEQDRGYGIEDLIRLGYEVEVIAKTSEARLSSAREEATRLGISLTVVPYVHNTFMKGGCAGMLWRLVRPWTWDGAAHEYRDPAIRSLVLRKLDEFKPDLVWFDYSYLWPLYSIVQSKKIPIITRSINFEPLHFLGEDGYSFKNILKSIPKFVSELVMAWTSDLVLTITPREEKIYRLFTRHTRNLPLRGLPHILRQHRTIRETKVLDVFFFGSTYNVSHNAHALEFLLTQIVPEASQRMPGQCRFHILGSKMPDRLLKLCTGSVIYEGFVPDLNVFLDQMDVAVIPSFIGAQGMQGKIFEPIVRGIPMIASSRGIAEYPFVSPQDFVAAETVVEFVDGLRSFLDIKVRQKVSENSLRIANEIFSKEKIQSVVVESIESLVK